MLSEYSTRMGAFIGLEAWKSEMEPVPLGPTIWTVEPYGPTALPCTVRMVVSAGANSVLDLHGFYINSGIRFDQLSVSGDLSLAGGNDTLSMQVNPYLLRPNIGTAIEYGSLPLVVVNGELTGAFDNGPTFLQDNIGWEQYTGSFTDAAVLPTNTYFLEYDTADDIVYLHYKVEGTVPEPGTAGLLMFGLLFVRGMLPREDDAI